MAFDKKDFGIAAGGALAFLLGWRRLAGIVWGIGGIYEYSRNKKVAGVLGMVGGGSFTLFPDWPGSLVSALKSSGSSSNSPTLPKANPQAAGLPPPVEIQVPPYQKVSFPNLDRELGGGWRVLDVRDIRDKATAARAQSLKAGDIASLVLQNKNGPYMVFNTRVLGGTAMTMYNAQWVSGPPVSGPQAIDFSAEHLFAVH